MREGNRTTDLLDIIQSDVCGPMRSALRSGGVFSAFQKYKAAAELLTGKKMKNLQSDNEKEYCNREIDQFLEENGIARKLTTPHTP